MSARNTLVYLLRHDLRVADNPILHHAAKSTDHGFTHLLPIYIFPARQIEVSGFVRDGEKSPYPEARSRLAGYWRCGPHRAKFLGQSVWNLKDNLESLGSGLSLQAGMPADVLDHVLKHLSGKGEKVGAVWMIGEEGVEEQQEEKEMRDVCKKNDVDCKVWVDEKYFIDDRDLDLASPDDLPDVFTTYRKAQEPLRTRPRKSLPRPEEGSLPPMPAASILPDAMSPFESAKDYQDLETRLLKPLTALMPDATSCPENAESAHPFEGGEKYGLERLDHLVKSGVATRYKETRNGLLGADFSTKLSAYLSLGCITARQVHWELVKFEDGNDAELKDVEGYGKGENEGTAAIRFELLWRDYMRLCSRKFKAKMFRRAGFWKEERYPRKWKSASASEAEEGQQPTPEQVGQMLERFKAGTTGMGLIDASMRELLHTGYTSNRARQNVASFLSRHLEIDWRYGAEWYEMLLVDYDVSSNWANWQYVAGTGNDPKETRIFNPVKQAFEYDPQGEYVKTWVPELAGLEKLENVFQACTTSKEELEKLDIADLSLVKDPLKRITFYVDRRPPKKHGRFYHHGQRGGTAKGDAPAGAPRGPRAAASSHRGREGGGRSPGGQHGANSPRGRGNGGSGLAFSGYGGPPSNSPATTGAYRGGRGGYNHDSPVRQYHHSGSNSFYAPRYYPVAIPVTGTMPLPGPPGPHWILPGPHM